MTQTEALKLARSVISSINRGKQHALTHNKETVFWQREEWVQWALDEVLPLIEEALAQPEQEPVAWMDANDPNRMTAFKWKNIGYHNTPLYTTSPQRKPLTDAIDWVKKRRDDFIDAHGVTDPDTGALEFGRGRNAEAKAEYVEELEEIIEGLLTIEAAHGIKENT